MYTADDIKKMREGRSTNTSASTTRKAYTAEDIEALRINKTQNATRPQTISEAASDPTVQQRQKDLFANPNRVQQTETVKPEKTYNEMNPIEKVGFALKGFPGYITNKSAQDKSRTGVLNAVSAATKPLDAPMNAFRTVASEGKNLTEFNPIKNAPRLAQAYKEGFTGERQTPIRDVLPSKYKEWADKHPTAGAVTDVVADIASNPTTWAGGLGLSTFGEKFGQKALQRGSLNAAENIASKESIKPVSKLLQDSRDLLAMARELNNPKAAVPETITPSQTAYERLNAEADALKNQSIPKKRTGPSLSDFEPTPPKVESETMRAGLSSEKPVFKNVPQTPGDLTKMELPESQSKFVAGTKKKPIDIKKAMSKLYTLTVDSNNPLKKVDDTAYRQATNSKNVGGIVDYIMKDGLVDKQGNRIGDSLQTVAKRVPKGKENSFWDYMSHRHNIDRAREGKPVQSNYTPDMSTEYVRRAELSNPEFKSIGDGITGWIDKFTRSWGVDTGIVNDELYDNLRNMYKSYFPTQRDFSEIEKGALEGASRRFVDQKTTIRKATGSDRDMRAPIENIMNLVNRTVRTAKRNEVGQSLLKSVREGKTNLAEIIPGNEGAFANTDNVVSVLENGKPVYLRINDKDLLDNLNNIGVPDNNGAMWLGRLLTTPYKSLITQKNPVFAARNVMRDIPTAYIMGSEKNPVKFVKNLASAGKDIASNSEAFQRYKAVGGGGSNFFNSGNVTKSAAELTGRKAIEDKFGKITGYKNLNPVGRATRKFNEAIESLNNFAESAPRLAEFKNVLDKTGDIDKALYAANDITTNFSRGGKVTKTLDAWVPYLNAGVQGLDKLARSLDPRNPTVALATLIKGGVAVTAPTVFFHYLNKDNPNYQQLDNRTKDNYYLIPNGDTFIKIPKSRELGVLFGALFDRILRQTEGDKEAWSGFLTQNGNPIKGTVGTNFSPANPLEDNILSPYFNLNANKDFAGRAIVSMNLLQNYSPRYQYDEKTSEIGKYIGDKFNISPKQIDYVIRAYTGVIGQMGLPAATKSNYNGNKAENLLKPITTQFVADPVYSNEIMTKFYDKLDKLTRTSNDKDRLSGVSKKEDAKQKTEEEAKVSAMNKYKKQITELNKKIDATSDNDEKRKLRQQMLFIASEALQTVK